MPAIAYIANEFPSEVEWYVADEIRELRARGVKVVACSAVRVRPEMVAESHRDLACETLWLRPMRVQEALGALGLCVRKAGVLADLLRRVVWDGGESPGRRLRALAHTLLGASLARRLREEGVEHIHAHHGYYSSWIALVAARLLGVPFSLSLHGSDLLLHGSYLDTKLEHCAFCRTVSEFNQQHILAHFPFVAREKVFVQRLGVDVPEAAPAEVRQHEDSRPITLLAVGRLHPVKDHAFLVQACYLLRECGVQIQCWIVGEGPERRALEFLIGALNLEDIVRLTGAVPHEQVASYYEMADLVVLTSRSEGIPLVLMEAMARARVVLAPAITGVPELVIDGKTGFLYPPGDLEGFVWRVDQIGQSLGALRGVRRAARAWVWTHFERKKNLERFAEAFLERIGKPELAGVYEDSVLQQI